MKKASLKLSFLVALLVIASCLPHGILAREVTMQTKPVQCVRPGDCVGQCNGCTANQCTAGLCVCGCAYEQQIQCQRPGDCVGRCNGCTVNKCTAGLCVCGCAIN